MDEPERPLPKPGEVWRLNEDQDLTLIGENSAMILEEGFFEPFDYESRAENRLGTFDEVFVRRSSLQTDYVRRDSLSDEYVSKKELSECLGESFEKDEDDVDVRFRVSEAFNVDY